MGLGAVLKTMKSENYIINKLDRYLLGLEDKDSDRRWDINSPSMSSSCCRAIYYSRTGTDRDANSIDARTRRIFDNGTHMHERTEQYLLDAGIAFMNEIPVVDEDLMIMGHADLIINISRQEKAIGELKSINDMNFGALKDAKEEHKEQALCYMYCIETRRKWIKKKCKSKLALKKFLMSKQYKAKIHELYDYFQDGSKFTKDEKLFYKLEQYKKLDRMLWELKKPISKMIFLYENKNNQELKEFTVHWDSKAVNGMKEKFEFINERVVSFRKDIKRQERRQKRELTGRELDKVRNKHMPDREGTSKSCSVCRWCNFKSECWIV